MLADVLKGSNHLDPDHPFRTLAFVVLDEVGMLVALLIRKLRSYVVYGSLFRRICCWTGRTYERWRGLPILCVWCGGL
ncbi:hypothetical protein EON65_05390 [archaeon]|nr:MAG: hypothetical protein EON65_05390 [archaeon]